VEFAAAEGADYGTVSNGLVTLNGRVDWQFQRSTAENVVRDLVGVRGGRGSALVPSLVVSRFASTLPRLDRKPRRAAAVSSQTTADDPLHSKPPVRTMRPTYVDRLPPCNDACPAGENIRHGLPRRRQAARARPGKSSFAAIPFRPCTAASAITRAKTPATGRISASR
jgi:BON domain-containing protein